MYRRLRRTAAILGLLPAIAAANTGLIQVTGIRTWSHADSTRVIVETTGPIDFKSDRAIGPDRLFFDILHARPWIRQRRLAVYQINDRLVRRVRIAETAPGTTRVVFDLAGPAEFEVSRLDSPSRLVIEFRPLGIRHRTDGVLTKLSPPVTGLQTDVKPPVRPGFVLPPARAPREIATLPNPPLFVSLQPLPVYWITDPLAVTVVHLPAGSAPAPAPPVTRVIPGSRPLASASASLASENASKSLTRALGLKVNRIVIDAGHGGHDYGTMGPNGTLEKDVVLDVALRLSKLIQEKMGTEVVLTRSDDTFIALHERTALANQYHADLFLSIHANSSPAPEVGGTETFYLNFTSTPDALNVAARENAGSEKSVGELRDLIQTITLNDKIEESHTFAENVQAAIQAQAARSNPTARNRGTKKAPFVVLIGASMPSVLAEIGFLSNPRDEANLSKPEYRQKLAEALYKGVSQYSQSLSHFEAPRQTARNDKTSAGVTQ
jgi:N-acetylmuramoyl-L-alanine amidase